MRLLDPTTPKMSAPSTASGDTLTLPPLITAELRTGCRGMVFLGSHLLCAGASGGTTDLSCIYVRLIPPASADEDWSWEVLYSPGIPEFASRSGDVDYHPKLNLVALGGEGCVAIFPPHVDPHTFEVTKEGAEERVKTVMLKDDGMSELVAAVRFEPSAGRYVATGCFDGFLRVYDLDAESGTPEVVFKHSVGDQVYGVDWSRDGSRIIVACYLTPLTVVDVTYEAGSGEARFAVRCELKGHTQFVRSCALSSSGRMGASAAYDRTMRLWKLDVDEEPAQDEGHPHLALDTHDSTVQNLAFSTDDAFVVGSSWGCQVFIWEVATGKLVAHRKTQIQADFYGQAMNDSLLAAVADKTLFVTQLPPQVGTSRSAVCFLSALSDEASTAHKHFASSAIYDRNVNGIIVGFLRGERGFRWQAGDS